MKYELIDALNWSSLRHMATSPLLYRWRIDHPRPDSAALSMGRVIHCAVLEPDEFASRYIPQPSDIDLRTKAGKEWRETVGDRELIKPADWAVVDRCVAAVNAHEPAHDLLAATKRELPAVWLKHGINCKARIDALKPGVIVDLKTTRDLGRFPRDAAELYYHGQLAWYLDGAVAAGLLSPDSDAYIVAVETSEPFDVAAFRLPQYVVQEGRNLCERLFSLWLECDRSGCWHGRFPAVTDLELPRWAYAEQEEDW